MALTSPAQDIPIYSHYISNPYIYNPAYAGIENAPTLILTHRRQWTGIEDAPVTSNLAFHAPIKFNLGLGALVTSDAAGIFRNTNALVSASYNVSLGWNHYLGFGISIGAGFQNLDLSSGVNLNDPALASVLESSSYLDGNAGIAYHYHDLNIGFSLPKLFSSSRFSSESFQKTSVNGIENFIITADYMFYMSQERNILQPYALFRSYEGFNSQFEGGLVFHINHLAWAGAFYRQDFGFGALLGLTLNGKFAFGYGIDIPTSNYSGVNLLSHEFQIGVMFGKSTKSKRGRRGKGFSRRRGRSSSKKKEEKKYVTFFLSEKLSRPEKPEPVKKEEEEEVAEEEIVIAEVEEETSAVDESQTPVEPEANEQEISLTEETLVGVSVAESISRQQGDSTNFYISDDSHTTPRYSKNDLSAYLLNQDEHVNPRFKGEAIPDHLFQSPIETIMNAIPEDQRPDELLKSTEDSAFAPGHYIVATTYRSEQVAIDYINDLKLDGINASYLFSSTNNKYYIILTNATDAYNAKEIVTNLEESGAFRGATYLMVL